MTRFFKRKAVRGVLMSGLVCPGVGQIFLGAKVRGSAMLVIAVGATFLLFSMVLSAANDISQQIISGELDIYPLNVLTLYADLRAALFQSFESVKSPRHTITLWIFFAVWIVSAVDAFLLGKKQDRP